MIELRAGTTAVTVVALLTDRELAVMVAEPAASACVRPAELT